MYLDVHLELNPMQVYVHADPVRAIAEMARESAEVECLKQGYELRHPEPVEVYSRSGIESATGKAVLLVATRWAVDRRV